MTSVYHFLFFRTKDRAEYLRAIMFLFATILELLIAPLHFLGIIGLQEWPMHICSASLLIVDLVLLCIWAFRKISITTAIWIASILSQIILSFRTMLLCMGHYPSALQMIAVNEVFTYLLVIMLVVAVMTYTTFVVVGINIATLLTAYFLTRDGHLIEITVLFGIIQVMTACFGIVQRLILKDTRIELNDFRHLSLQLQRFFRMSISDISAMLSLANSRHANALQNGKVLDSLSLHAQNGIIATADMIKEHHIRQRTDMHEIFPTLTKTELIVGRLIASGKSIKEIANELDKNVSNIGTVRGNIRRKLGLQSNEDLKDCLINSLKG